jgi:anti-sigma regulatory factor (Ser/Thr protein kinase)
MSTVRLAFSPDPAYVRTVRLVTSAVARRAGVAGETLDELRLAIGEACSRAISLHRRDGLRDLIHVELSDGDRFIVRVTDRSPGVPGAANASGRVNEAVRARMAAGVQFEASEDDEITFDMAVALLTGLVSDLKVTHSVSGVGSEVEMSWPVGRH